MSTSPTLTPADLRGRLPELMLRDQRRLRRRLDGIGKVQNTDKRHAILAEIAEEVTAAHARVTRRRGAVPTVSHPPELPISDRAGELRAAIRDHQVVIVAGETGSGKTTQLPKMCLELGRGVHGMIGHTQPRRLAARTVAERVASELDTSPGTAVGWKIRFTDRSSEDTLVKVMTDGILLAEIQSDRWLRGYDTLIIDEAHERSLNVDFLLGYVKQLLARRDDLKVIITSATIDPDRFSRYFDDAPVIEVSGRTYPVEVRHRPIHDPDDPASDPDRDQTQAICDAVDELTAEDRRGDILIFCSGEREIRDTADALGRKNLDDTEILPLYARLAAADQHRVFQPHGTRRIVLATNVAETSLTVPGIAYVIDPGMARVSRYSPRTKVQRLPIEPISQASADQRKGRCGRTSPGICIRLYSEEDYLARPRFTDPEILRTNLASVILAMAAADLGDVESFGFLDPPDPRNIQAGLVLLAELGAIESRRAKRSVRLTEIGKKLAQLPLDPRLGRMILEAETNGCVHEVTIIAAALSIQDPRERPAEAQQAADECHRRFADENSDFLAYLNLWRYLRQQQKQLSSNQFRKLCRREFLNYLRVREWQDLVTQLRQAANGIGATVNTVPAEPDRVHQVLLVGLLSHIGLRDPDKRDYQGARGTRFSIFPGSSLFSRQPSWVMAAELVETSKLWGRIVARIEPEWIEPLAEHLTKRQYFEQAWSRKQGAVMAYERVTLYGIPIVARRRVHYGRIDPELCRELFIRHALVEGDWDTDHAFFHANQRRREEAEELEHRTRRRDIVVDDETLFDFYDQRIGREVVSARHFDTWWKKTRQKQPDLLDFTTALLVDENAEVNDSDYPDFWTSGAISLRLSYQFEPGTDDDGVTVDIPLHLLNQLDQQDFSWQVPGLRAELVTALIRSLPKSIRRQFVPAPEYAAALLDRLTPRSEPLTDAMERELGQLGDVQIPREAWSYHRIPPHLVMRFRIFDDHQNTIASGTDLAELKARLRPQLTEQLSQAARHLERDSVHAWDFGELPRWFEQPAATHAIQAYPALVDEQYGVAIRLLDTPEQQRRAMWRGTRRLLRVVITSPLKSVIERLPRQSKLALGASPHASIGELLEDCLTCAIDKLMADAGGPAWDEQAFAALRAAVQRDVQELTYDTLRVVEEIVTTARAAEKRLTTTNQVALLPSLSDIQTQLANLIYPGFITDTGADQLRHLPRYLQAIEQRLDKLPTNSPRDQVNLRIIEQIQAEYDDHLQALGEDAEPAERLREVRWMIEELRVSYFAQELRTAYPISDKRIRKVLHTLER